ELLIEEDEILRLDLRPLLARAKPPRPAARADGYRKHPLFLQVIPNLVNTLANLDGFHNFAARLCILANEFHELFVVRLSETLNEIDSLRHLEFKEIGL